MEILSTPDRFSVKNTQLIRGDDFAACAIDFRPNFRRHALPGASAKYHESAAGALGAPGAELRGYDQPREAEDHGEAELAGGRPDRISVDGR